MNFKAFDEDSEVMAPVQVKAIRQLLGQAIPVVIRATSDQYIPSALRGASLRGPLNSGGPVEHLVAINLGPESGNLAVVACRSAEQLAAFRQANPALGKALITSWKSWHLLWLKTDTRPENVASDNWMWLTQGVIPLSWLVDDEPVVQIVADGEPAEIAFTEVRWPGILVEAFRLERLKQCYGPVFHQKGRRKLVNEFFWANWLAEKLDLIYDSRLSVFGRVLEAGGEVRTLTTEAVVHLAHEALHRAAASVGNSFPIEELRVSRIKQLIEVMKTATAIEPHGVAEGLEAYFRQRLTPHQAATVTTEELWLDYISFCKERNLIAYPQREFLRRVTARIREIFGSAKSHDIKREGKPKRGFRGLAFAKDPKSQQSHRDHPMIEKPSTAGPK